MVLNYIWVAFFLVAFVIAAVKLLFWGDYDVFPSMMDSTFSSSKTAFEISLGLTGVLSLWMGVMKVGEKGGVVNVLARLLSPVFTKLFPDIPKGHPVTGSIFMNIAANMLGLDNAATPLGLKAMEQMQELNTKKDTASNPMIMFLVLNTSGLTLIPVSIMVYRAQMGAAQPATYRYFYPHPVGNLLFNSSGYYRYLPIPAYQPAESYHVTHVGWRLYAGGCCHLGILTDGFRDDESLEYHRSQHPADDHYYRIYRGRCT